MTRDFSGSGRAPTPAELMAFGDGELRGEAAARVESWLTEHSDAVEEVDAGVRLVNLFRDHPAPEPAPAAWSAAADRVAEGVSRRPPRWRPLLWLTVMTAAAVGAFAAALTLPRPARQDPPQQRPVVRLPAEDDNEVPFAVAPLGEVNILRMEATDADRVLIGDPLLEPFDFVASEEIEVVGAEPDADEGNMPKLRKGPRLPMVVVARNE